MTDYVFSYHAKNQFYARLPKLANKLVVLKVENYVSRLPIYENVIIEFTRNRNVIFLFVVRAGIVVTAVWTTERYINKKFANYKRVKYTEI